MLHARQRIVDSHRERKDIGVEFVEDGRAHTHETFEPFANMIEQKMIDLREKSGLGLTHH